MTGVFAQVRDGIGSAAARLRDALLTLDRSAARAALRRYEAVRGVAATPDGGDVSQVSLDALLAVLRSSGRRVEAHLSVGEAAGAWQTGVLAQLESALPKGVQLVIISWDALDATQATSEVATRVATYLRDAGVEAGGFLVTAEKGAFLDALGIAPGDPPWVRAVDADGGVLRAVQGDLDEHAIAGLRRLWGA